MGADGRPKKVENEVLERKIRLLEAELDLYKLKYDEALHALGEENPQAARDINEWA